MTPTSCEWVRDRLPDRPAGRMEASERERLEAHLDGCGDCRDELALVTALWEGRPQPSYELAERVRERLQRERDRRRRGHPWWMAVAAALVVALGTGVVWSHLQGPEGPGSVLLTEDVESDLWPGGETLVAGGLVWDDLSEEEIQALLEDLD